MKKKKQQKKNIKSNTRYGRNYKTKKVKVKRIRFKRVIVAIFILLIIIFTIKCIMSIPITNIYVSGNKILSDQEIIELSSLEKYPSFTSFTTRGLKKKLEKNTYIKSASVRRKLLEVYISIEENRPLIYLDEEEKTVLLDKTKVDYKYDVPVVLNYIPDTLYDKFLVKLSSLDDDIFNRISEVLYVPNDVDDARFLFYMNDGNRVYLTLKRLDNLNNYFDIMKEVLAKYNTDKGTLYLDEGEYFEVY